MSQSSNGADLPSSAVEPQSKQEDLKSISAATRASSSTIAVSNKSTPRRSTNMKKRRSSLFEMARNSFYRSRGQSGASVETLRGNTGADFEGYATVERCNGDGIGFDINPFSCCFPRHRNGLYFLLIKGFHCFVFKDEEGKSPKYAIELINRKAVVHPSQDTSHAVVHLETGLGDVEYKFFFYNRAAADNYNKDSHSTSIASAFCRAVSVASSAAQAEQVRNRLGHSKLISKRTSVSYANTIGAAKTKEQPEAPVGVGEVMREMPNVTEVY